MKKHYVQPEAEVVTLMATQRLLGESPGLGDGDGRDDYDPWDAPYRF